MHETNRVNAPLPNFSQISVTKRGGEVAHFPKLTIHITAYALLP